MTKMTMVACVQNILRRQLSATRILGFVTFCVLAFFLPIDCYSDPHFIQHRQGDTMAAAGVDDRLVHFTFAKSAGSRIDLPQSNLRGDDRHPDNDSRHTHCLRPHKLPS